jgi:uncharacterized protein (TIGR00297 family)
MRLTLAPLGRFDLGAAAAALIAFLAFRLEALTAGGALAAFVVGSIAFGALDIGGAAVLLAFFISSLALSRFGRARKRALERDLGKSGPRDAMQVLANGGVAAICALLALGGDAHYAIAFCGAFAAATADTWATELGTIFGGRPRSVVTWRPIDVGLSGGVTALGTAAEIAGALCIAAVAYSSGFRSFWAIAIAGLCGALVDSLLGATIQKLRWCPQCRRACEREPHGCGANTTPLRPWAVLDNDAVNLLATAAGAGVGYVLSAAFP